DFPGVSVRIGKISTIAAVIGLFRLAHQACAGLDRLGKDCVAFGRGGAVPGERRATERLGLGPPRRDPTLGQLPPVPYRPNHAGLVDTPEFEAARAELSSEARRLVKTGTRVQAAATEGHRGQFRGRYCRANEATCSDPRFGFRKCSAVSERRSVFSPDFAHAI